MLRHLRSLWLPSSNPSFGLVLLKCSYLSTAERKPFTEEEIRAMVKVAPPEWERAIMASAMTGLRLRDCLRLKPSDYNSKLDAICVVESKTRKPLTIPVKPKLRKLIQKSLSA